MTVVAFCKLRRKATIGCGEDSYRLLVVFEWELSCASERPSVGRAQLTGKLKLFWWEPVPPTGLEPLLGGEYK